MPLNCDAETIYNARNRFDHDKALGACARHWAHWGAHSTVQQNDDIRYVDKPFVHCGEEQGYTSRLGAVIGQLYLLSAEDLPTASIITSVRLDPMIR